MKRMLINATQTEERRLAIVDGQKLLDYEIEIEGRGARERIAVAYVVPERPARPGSCPRPAPTTASRSAPGPPT